MTDTTATGWLANAPAGLVALMKRMTWHHKVNWNAPDYIEADEFGTDDEGKPKGDGRQVVDELALAEALSSRLQPLPWEDPNEPRHMLALDLDVDAWLVPSSSEGHSHLYVDIPGGVIEEGLWKFLDAAAAIGLVEPGYVSACKSRGMTSVRAPWVRKGHEPSTVERAHAMADAAPAPVIPLPSGREIF